MRIVILGTRGIPNRYGGFEYFAENMAEGLTNLEHEVFVFEPSPDAVPPSFYGKAQRYPIRVSIRLPKNARRLLYDYRSLVAARRLKPDIVIRCGYSHAIFLPFFGSSFRNRITTNVDGLEWKRGKWSLFGKVYLRFCEYLNARLTRRLVADSMAIQSYMQKKHGKPIEYIPYGAEIPSFAPETHVKSLGLTPNQFFLAVARLEPENGIEDIIDAALQAKYSLAVVGPTTTPYAQRLLNRYGTQKGVYFLGGIYDRVVLDSLRSHCKAYIHGHSVGGTNPTLLEAMACGCTIVARDNAYNREVLNEAGRFYGNQADLLREMDLAWNISGIERETNREEMRRLILTNYQWNRVIERYLAISYPNPIIPKK